MGRFLGQLSSDAYGATVDEIRVGHFNIPADKVVAPDADGILDGTAFPAAAGTVTTFLAQPPTAMTLTAVASGTQTGKVTIHGFDIGGNKISEELTMTSDTPVAGVKAFAEVTAIDLPIKEGSETIDVGWGAKFGLPYKLAADELVIVKLFNGAADAGTVTNDATELAKNVYDPNGTPDGEKALDFYILV
jgi:hypothetical protein